MEDIEEPAADGGGQDMVLVTAGTRADPSKGQEHCQRRTHAEEVFHLRDKKGKDSINILKEVFGTDINYRAFVQFQNHYLSI